MATEHDVDHDVHAPHRHGGRARPRRGDGARRLLQSLLTSGVDDTVTEVVMPVLHDVGDGWERGDLGVLHEHFVSSTFRGVLGELRMPVQGDQLRTVVLACPPRELHDLPLELFGAMLHARWWRVVEPRRQHPDGRRSATPCASSTPTRACSPGCAVRAFESRIPSLTRLAERVPLFLAGEGALGLPTPPAGTTVLPRDLRAAAATRRRRHRPRRRPCTRVTVDRARGRLTRHTVERCGSPTSDTPACSSRWPTPGSSSTPAPSPTTCRPCATSMPSSSPTSTPTTSTPTALPGPRRRQPRRRRAVRPDERRGARRPRGRGPRARTGQPTTVGRHRDPVRRPARPHPRRHPAHHERRCAPRRRGRAVVLPPRRRARRGARDRRRPRASRSRRRGSAAAT